MAQEGKPAKRGLASVADARALMLAGVKTLESETAGLVQALGRTVARDVIASRDQPLCDSGGRLTVRPFEDRDSALLSVIAAASVLIRLPPDAADPAAGALVDVLPLDTAGC